MSSTRPIHGTTPLPNHLFDLMPGLTDTEWRLLCVLARQTPGWRSGDGRKERDWLSHAQLRSRTGRASEAVSRGVDRLVRRGLVEVSNVHGEILVSPAERRRYAGRLYFRLTPRSLGSVPDGATAPGKAEATFSESENRKAKTTKETGTKGIPCGIDGACGKPCGKVPDGLKQEATGAGNSGTNGGEVRLFLLAYVERFRTVSPRGEPPPVAWGKDGRLARDLLRTYPLERLLELLDRFLTSPEPWIRRSGYSLGAFRAAVGRLLLDGPAPQPPRRDEGRYRGWARAGGPGQAPAR